MSIGCQLDLNFSMLIPAEGENRYITVTVAIAEDCLIFNGRPPQP